MFIFLHGYKYDFSDRKRELKSGKRQEVSPALTRAYRIRATLRQNNPARQLLYRRLVHSIQNMDSALAETPRGSCLQAVGSLFTEYGQRTGRKLRGCGCFVPVCSIFTGWDGIAEKQPRESGCFCARFVLSLPPTKRKSEMTFIDTILAHYGWQGVALAGVMLTALCVQLYCSCTDASPPTGSAADRLGCGRRPRCRW